MHDLTGTGRRQYITDMELSEELSPHRGGRRQRPLAEKADRVTAGHTVEKPKKSDQRSGTKE